MSRGYALQADVSLRALNTFGVEGRAAGLVTVQDAEALPAALAETRIKDLPLICIGDGSNVLFVGDFPGVVLRQAAAGVACLGMTARSGAYAQRPRSAGMRFVDWTLLRRIRRAREPRADPWPGRCGTDPEHRRLRNGDRRVRHDGRGLGSKHRATVQARARRLWLHLPRQPLQARGRPLDRHRARAPAAAAARAASRLSRRANRARINCRQRAFDG